MLVKCVSYYYDQELKKVINIGDKYDVNEERAKVLVDNKVAEIIEESTTPDVATEPKKKAPARKKKTGDK